ncbi:MAG: cAMP phosphodiesterase [Vulcanococcus sp.]
MFPLVLLMAAGPALAAPATEADMSLYTRIAALNVCISRTAGTEFDKAVAVAGETIAQVIQGQHGGQIAQVGPKALTIEELRKGSINSAVLGAVEVCPKEVPADVKKKVDEVLKGAGSQAPATPATKPAPAAKP